MLACVRACEGAFDFVYTEDGWCVRIDACIDESNSCVPCRCRVIAGVNAKVYVHERTSVLESRSDRIGNCTDASSVRDVSDVARFNASDTCGERSLFFLHSVRNSLLTATAMT